MITTARARPGSGDLVPIAERLRLMQGFRLLIAAFAAVVAWRNAGTLDARANVFAAATVAYVGMGLVGQLAFRASRRDGIAVFACVLLVDGLYLAWAAYVTGGSGSPLRYLIILHVIAVALLASYRTGMKIALWHSLLLLVVYYARDAGILRPLDEGDLAPGTPLGRLVVFSAVLWIAAIATSHFSAVNERELRRRRYDLEALAAMAEQLELTKGTVPTAEVLLERAADAFAIDRAVVLASLGGDELELVATLGATELEQTHAAAGPGSVVTEVLTSRRTRLAGGVDPTADPLLAALLPGARSLVIVPLTADGYSIGVLVAERTLQGRRIERRIVTMLERFAAYGSLALRNAWLLEQVQMMAATDALTGLPNRATVHSTLARELARAAREGRQLTLVMLDVDHFKAVNDAFGHQVGDRVLQRVASQLDRVSRGGDLMGRYGGEEFAAVLPETGAEGAIIAAERLRRAVADDPGEPALTASLGMATYPDDALDADGLVRAADRALYASKAAGRNRVTRAADVAPTVES